MSHVEILPVTHEIEVRQPHFFQLFMGWNKYWHAARPEIEVGDELVFVETYAGRRTGRKLYARVESVWPVKDEAEDLVRVKIGVKRLIEERRAR
jgi:hypothetical protein